MRFSQELRTWVALSVGCALLALFLPAFSARAWDKWDGHRQGFVLGGGVGPGLLVENSGSQEDIKLSPFSGDFLIGYSATNQFQIVLASSMADDPTDDRSGIDFAAPCVVYYLKPSVPSPFVLGGFGTISSNGNDRGYGFRFSGGYEFLRHVGVVATVVWGKTTGERYLSNSPTYEHPFAASLMLVVLGY